MSILIQVNIAEMKIASGDAILTCLGLGSCVGVTLYDPQKKIGGLAHIMLPKSNVTTENVNLGKFADTCISWMVEEISSKGAKKNRIQAKLFGGANMFSQINNPLLVIGKRNIDAVIHELNDKKIPILAQDVGGTVGRTIYFEIATGKVRVRTLKTPGEMIF